MSKEAYYFSHDSNAINDTKINDMLFDFGITGYGMFWVIVEKMRESEDFKLTLSRGTFRTLSKIMMINDIKVIEDFIEKCIEDYGLFIREGEAFYSQSLLRRMEKKEEIKQKRKEAVNKRWNKNNSDVIQEENKSNTFVIQNDTKERKGNQRKGKERKEKEIKSNHIDGDFVSDDDLDSDSPIPDFNLFDYCKYNDIRIPEGDLQSLIDTFGKDQVEEAVRSSIGYKMSDPKKYLQKVIEQQLNFGFFDGVQQMIKQGKDPF